MGKRYKVIIIGSGPAGMTAALYTARAELKPLVLAGREAGGQLMLTTDVENFPGFTSILGPELMKRLTEHAQKFGAEIVRVNVTKVDFSARPLRLWVDRTEYQAEAMIIATGASAQWLGLESETRLRGKGVSSCATCDGFFFRDKKIAVVGGGDTALEEATFLTRFASHVTLIHRRDAFRASKPLQQRASNDAKISVLWNQEVQQVLGDRQVTGLKLRNTQTDEVSEISVSGLFVAIGHKPNTEIFQGQLELDEKGYIVGYPNSATSKEGVFVAGDVEDHRYRQAITAAGAGCKAAIDAERWLSDRLGLESRTILYGN
ncbi:thioredoxin-disulfide reductase [Candidatus Berkelbacteria bacterium]|nr:thioredoxin-disulfide reductase [Candidatus Berkelbacteria bacterium]